MQKVTNTQKLEIISLIEAKKQQLRTSSAVAVFCGVSESTISRMLTNDYVTKNDEAWLQVGAKLGWKPNLEDSRKPWVIVPTQDYRSIRQLAIDAKEMGLFLPISDVAGIGKTNGCLLPVAKELANHYTYYIRCNNWGIKLFLQQLCQTLGVNVGNGNKTPNDYIDMVVEYFQTRAIYKPLLIIDEFDKLKASAKQVLIPLYNECEDGLACIVAGTEHLEKEIKKGVKLQAKGFDEIDSRLGRNYIKLMGCTVKEAQEICHANGITDKAQALQIIEDCKPIRKAIKIKEQDTFIRVVTDLRRLKRLVQRQVLINNKNQ